MNKKEELYARAGLFVNTLAVLIALYALFNPFNCNKPRQQDRKGLNDGDVNNTAKEATCNSQTSFHQKEIQQENEVDIVAIEKIIAETERNISEAQKNQNIPSSNESKSNSADPKTKIEHFQVLLPKKQLPLAIPALQSEQHGFVNFYNSYDFTLFVKALGKFRKVSKEDSLTITFPVGVDSFEFYGDDTFSRKGVCYFEVQPGYHNNPIGLEIDTSRKKFQPTPKLALKAVKKG